MPTIQASPPPPQEHGSLLFATQCATCHQGDGRGMPGHFPSLSGDLAVGMKDPTAMTSIVLFGGKGGTIAGQTYSSAMPAFDKVLNDEEVAAVETYVRSRWHNDAPAVSQADVARVRAARPKEGGAGAP